MNKHLFSIGLCVALASAAAQAEDVNVSKLPAAASKTGVTFDTDIKPIFEKSCYKCHGPEVEKPKGKFRADTRASVLKGGGEGASVTPGDIKKSSLLAMIAYVTADEELYMPPKENKAKIAPLSKEEVSLVRAWIEQGAK
ncbi:MAG TPA: c-type cytochrome domain-containing protein [Candidatus Acidoferrum sp.]|nr:c-type cytochrome domain-containing protein [Candidatus Acidoferrum sp.]